MNKNFAFALIAFALLATPALAETTPTVPLTKTTPSTVGWWVTLTAVIVIVVIVGIICFYLWLCRVQESAEDEE